MILSKNHLPLQLIENVVSNILFTLIVFMSKKSKYKFNAESLDFVKIEFSYDELFRRLFTYSFTSVIIGLVFFFLAFNFIDSPHVKNLRVINKDIKYKYEVLNKQINAASAQLSEIQHHDNKMFRPFFEAEEIPSSVRIAGFGGVNSYTEFDDYEDKNTIVSTFKKLDVVTKQLYIQSKSFDDVTKLIKNKHKMLASIPAIQPIKNKDLTAFGPFGMRMHPILKIYRLHAGVDLCAPLNTPIYAAGDGVITAAKFGRGGIGYYIRIYHGYGFQTVYGHLNEMKVKPGQRVKRGDIIALMGTTGISNVSHVHYEVHKNGKPVNPVNYYFEDLTDEEYERLIDISSTELNSDYD